MNSDRQVELATRFYNMHRGSQTLVLGNVWDVGSAVIFEKAGCQAIGTTSAGIAYALGYPDGQRITLDDILDLERNIVERVQIPLTVDIESGYGNSIDAVVESVSQVIRTGAVGINIEDSRSGLPPTLIDLTEQCSRIRAIADLKSELGIPFVINVRADAVWLGIGEPDQRINTAIQRSNAYLEAGADCAYIPGVADRETIATLVKQIDGPLNILASPHCPSVTELQQLGVARLSIGSAPMRATLGLTQQIARELIVDGRYSKMFETILEYEAANVLFASPNYERS